MAVAHQPGLLQDAKVLRDGGLRHAGPSRQGPDRLLTFPAETLENPTPRRVGQRSEEHVMSVWHRNR
jgi:hypothetical protein